jgi:hypothetical protein
LGLSVTHLSPAKQKNESERKKSLSLLSPRYVHHGVRSDAHISVVSGSFLSVLFSFSSILMCHDRRYWRFLTALVQGKGLQFRWGGWNNIIIATN